MLGVKRQERKLIPVILWYLENYRCGIECCTIMWNWFIPSKQKLLCCKLSKVKTLSKIKLKNQTYKILKPVNSFSKGKHSCVLEMKTVYLNPKYKKTEEEEVRKEKRKEG